MLGTTEESNGTTIKFKADAEIFDTTEYEFDILAERFKELSYLNKGLTIFLSDEREEKEKKQVFFSEGGIKDFLNDISKGEKLSEEMIYVSGNV